MKKELKKVDESIAYWTKICEDYPLAPQYKEVLAMMHRERVRIVEKIGRK
jgi:hypothetical protein